MAAHTAILSWDWREQPDLDVLAEILRDLTDGSLHLHQVDTGSDEYAIVVTTVPMSNAEVSAAYGQYTQPDEARR